MTDITELAQREKFEAWFVNDVVGADVTFPAFEDGAYAEGEIYDEQLYFMLQAMWMAWKAAGAELVEALEKAQQRIDSQREYYEGVITDGGKRIAELEESHAQVIQSRDHYKRMTKEGLKQLAEARTVKLPDLRQIVSGDRYVWSDGVYNYSQDVKVALAAAGIKVEAE
ncbi:RelE family toxin-antitoxin system [Klebsiella pneumoniae]|nr:RelE family toxin-antitoxin system [Klebsiella pneumoniae]HBX8615057.1 hypothetical protein [Klebsiella pneumoniae]HBX9793000.1 hypothetical protein [Klebsiella pneumoniae]HBX9804214.1 hypothetical protein [Klebsiella pneumoniae]